MCLVDFVSSSHRIAACTFLSLAGGETHPPRSHRHRREMVRVRPGLQTGAVLGLPDWMGFLAQVTRVLISIDRSKSLRCVSRTNLTIGWDCSLDSFIGSCIDTRSIIYNFEKYRRKLVLTFDLSVTPKKLDIHIMQTSVFRGVKRSFARYCIPWQGWTRDGVSMWQ